MAQSIFMKKLRDSMGVIFFIVAILFVASIAFRGLAQRKPREQDRENTIAVVNGDDKIEYSEFAKELESTIQNSYDRGQSVDDFAAEDFREQAWHAVINRHILKPQFDEKLVAGFTGVEIYEKLKSVGFEVYPINPKHNKINNNVCYSNLKSLPKKPNVVITVVPPKVTEKIVDQCKNLKIDKIWMQPGSESEKAIEFCKNNNIEVMYGACFVVDALKQDF